MADSKASSSSRPSFPQEKLITFEQALKQVEAKPHKELADLAHLMRLLMDIPKTYRPPVRMDKMDELKHQICCPTATVNVHLDDIFPAAPLSNYFPNAPLPKEGEESELAKHRRMVGWGEDSGKEEKEEGEESELAKH